MVIVLHKIVLTHGRQQEVTDGPAIESNGQNLAEIVDDALKALLMRRSDRGDGLPDGYKVFDENGRLIKAEWIEVTRDAPRSWRREAPCRRDRERRQGHADRDGRRGGRLSPEVRSAAAELGSRGGKARAAKLSKKKRRDIAKAAAAKRWGAE
jgi:hypothetical protein